MHGQIDDLLQAGDDHSLGRFASGTQNLEDFLENQLAVSLLIDELNVGQD